MKLGDLMSVYEKAKAFCQKYPGGVYWWRIKKHAEIVERHLNPGEFVKNGIEIIKFLSEIPINNKDSNMDCNLDIVSTVASSFSESEDMDVAYF